LQSFRANQHSTGLGASVLPVSDPTLGFMQIWNDLTLV
jgi:hypothetical protein